MRTVLGLVGGSVQKKYQKRISQNDQKNYHSPSGYGRCGKGMEDSKAAKEGRG
jgi:hypothetical protein